MKPRDPETRGRRDSPPRIRPDRQTLGMFAAARALSAETCELCGGKGDPLADADGQPAGCRCSRCR